MTANGEVRAVEDFNLPKKSSNIITKFLPQRSFDKVSIILAEVLGTAGLVFFGCASTVHWNGPPSGIGPMVTFGTTVGMIIQTFGHVSMALLNPAVTVCAVVNDMLSITMGFVLTLAQCIGAALGYGLLKFVTPDRIFSIPSQGTCVTVLHPELSVAQGFFVEFFATSALICMICGVWDPRNKQFGDSAAIRIGKNLKFD